jgi:hypothetical protein
LVETLGHGALPSKTRAAHSQNARQNWRIGSWSPSASARATGSACGCCARFEVQNLTNERIFDYYGIQRPARSFAVKLTGDWN